jgi:hypothetical protein
MTTDILTARPENRMRVWRDFRATLTEDQSDAEQLRAVAAFWSRCPQVTYCVDWDRPETWPGPWEILNDGLVCPTGLAILMAHTLLLVGENRWQDRILIRVVRDTAAGYLTVVVVDGQNVLNFDIGKVAQIQALEQSAATIESYAYSGGKYIAVK